MLSFQSVSRLYGYTFAEVYNSYKLNIWDISTITEGIEIVQFYYTEKLAI